MEAAEFRALLCAGAHDHHMMMTLDRTTKIGLTVDWWVTLRDVQPVRQAMLRAFLALWLPVVESALRQNEESNRLPATWDQLATVLDRHFASVWRAKTGKVSVGWYDAELIAEILQLRIEQLTPTREQWLPLAAEYLGEGAITSTQAAVYAMYRTTDRSGEESREDVIGMDDEAVEAMRSHWSEFLSTDALRRDILQASAVIGQRIDAAQDATSAKRKKA